ncbi:hypothetical protein [Alkalihalobacterium alkalinitrilicum]|uniref:hypothetical protein n=1 Tax=Alkalihalobacterium alkalinitrilicum TaxID=427920 RepID=UPI000995297B|nr:hypothetical protein [Alkalihalobacterium alkalinitrilicum]
MENAYQEFLDTLDGVKEKKRGLALTIRGEQDQLRLHEQEYKNLILEGEDKKADQLFEVIFNLKKNIESHTRKLNVLNSSEVNTSGLVKNAANKAVVSISEDLVVFDEEYKSIHERVQKAKENYLKEIVELGEVVRLERKKKEQLGFVLKHSPEKQKEFGSMYHQKLGYMPLTVDDIYSSHLKGLEVDYKQLKQTIGGFEDE